MTVNSVLQTFKRVTLAVRDNLTPDDCREGQTQPKR